MDRAGRRHRLNILLWVLQVLAALMYAASGVMKVITASDSLARIRVVRIDDYPRMSGHEIRPRPARCA